MKITLFLALLFIIIIGGGYLWKGHPVVSVTTPAASSMPVATATTTSSAPVTTTPTTPASNTYTKQQVAAHDTSSSCWTSINGNVYDVTSWISQHPGGEGHIESLCGNDGTSAFEGQHSGDTQANDMLASFKIGTLSQ